MYIHFYLYLYIRISTVSLAVGSRPIFQSPETHKILLSRLIVSHTFKVVERKYWNFNSYLFLLHSFKFPISYECFIFLNPREYNRMHVSYINMPVMGSTPQKDLAEGCTSKKFEPSLSISLHCNSPKAGDNYKNLVQLLPKDWAGPRQLSSKATLANAT